VDYIANQAAIITETGVSPAEFVIEEYILSMPPKDTNRADKYVSWHFDEGSGSSAHSNPPLLPLATRFGVFPEFKE